MRLQYRDVFCRLEPSLNLENATTSEVQILCPFHHDEVPSCRINLQSGLWKCFGCQKAGSAPLFVSLYVPCSLEAARNQVTAWLGEDRKILTAPIRKRSRIHRRGLIWLTGWLITSVEQHRFHEDVQAAVRARDLARLQTTLLAKGSIQVFDTMPRLRNVDLALLGTPAWWRQVEDVISQTIQRSEIPPDIVAYYMDGLTPDHAREIMLRRIWTRRALREFHVGYDDANHRFTIPVYVDGACVNIRKYRPGAVADKMVSYGEGYGSPRFFPHDAMRSARKIYWLEGEPDTILAHQLELPAITVTGGAGSVPTGYPAYLKGKEVVLCFDCDDAGRNGMRRVARLIAPFVQSVLLLDLALTKRGGDFTDFIQDGHTVSEFLSLIPIRGS